MIFIPEKSHRKTFLATCLVVRRQPIVPQGGVHLPVLSEVAMFALANLEPVWIDTVGCEVRVVPQAETGTARAHLQSGVQSDEQKCGDV